MSAFAHCWECSLYFLSPVTQADARSGELPAMPELRRTYDADGNETTPVWAHDDVTHHVVFGWD